MVKNLPANAGDSGLIPGLGRLPGEGNNHPLQSCLENSMDREAWQAIVHEITRSWTQLSTHIISLYFLTYFKETESRQDNVSNALKLHSYLEFLTLFISYRFFANQCHLFIPTQLFLTYLFCVVLLLSNILHFSVLWVQQYNYIINVLDYCF